MNHHDHEPPNQRHTTTTLDRFQTRIQKFLSIYLSIYNYRFQKRKTRTAQRSTAQHQPLLYLCLLFFFSSPYHLSSLLIIIIIIIAISFLRPSILSPPHSTSLPSSFHLSHQSPWNYLLSKLSKRVSIFDCFF
ncbi:uncharacterized protein GGS25DRAFT_496487 [Hypoxylon fragiforme]|uniref:uncharacterized protein n=1 Tax=Hypoxylon fragiforme TaxID=63214 RepID=UPI0020C6E36B|nr:uncharacterized protein GGS25DRAFT_496487 [Hypoxylon fragiforme]KAI2607550.1 hypothetical protein GGS25DRAFT_496487 [Hypoxylon fragiforme]